MSDASTAPAGSPLRRGPPLDQFAVLGLAGAAALAGALFVPVVSSPSASGLLAPVAGSAAVLALWLGLSPPYAVAAGVALVATLGAPVTVPSGALAVGGGFLVLAADLARDGAVGPAVVALASATVGLLTTLGVAAVAGADLPSAAFALAAVGATLVYGTHRYELVRMGLVDDE